MQVIRVSGYQAKRQYRKLHQAAAQLVSSCVLRHALCEKIRSTHDAIRNEYRNRKTTDEVDYTMGYFLSQLVIVARRSNETEHWMNILFVVLLAAFWAIANLLKSRKKVNQQQQKKTPSAPKQLTHSYPRFVIGRSGQHPRIQLEPVKTSQQKPIKKPVTKKLIEQSTPFFAPMTEEKSPLDTILYFSDTEELKRAIIYYEILGKPLAFRDF